jgi:hypothetical protein
MPNKVNGAAITSGTPNVAASTIQTRPCPDNRTTAVED